MNSFTSKITIPIILVGLFSIVVFISLNYEHLGVTFYLILLLLSVYIFSFGFAVGHSLASPVRKLLEKTKELSRGNFSSRVYLHTKDELAELADVINKIAEEMQENQIDSKMIEKSVDMKTKERTQVLEESVNALEEKVKNRAFEFEKILAESTSLQEQIKNKEIEVIQLKDEVEKMAKKLQRGKTKKIKQRKKSNARIT